MLLCELEPYSRQQNKKRLKKCGVILIKSCQIYPLVLKDKYYIFIYKINNIKRLTFSKKNVIIKYENTHILKHIFKKQ